MKYTQGEIADRITILELKAWSGLDTQKELHDARAAFRGSENDLKELRDINRIAWHQVNTIHHYFDTPDKLVTALDKDLCLSACLMAHQLNRMRVAAKNAINRKFNEPEELKTWKQPTI